jgi:hypothetical protein
MLEGIDAIALGPWDWKLGKDAIEKVVADNHLPVLAANLACDGASPWPASAVIERGGLKIGIVGLTDGEVPGCTVGDPIEAARTALAGLGPVDASLVLAPLDPAQISAFTQANLPLDFVLLTDARQADAPAPFGAAWQLQPGSRGRAVGVAELEHVAGTTGWAGPDASKALELDGERYTKRVEDAQRRLDTTTDPVDKDRVQKQLTAYQTRLDQSKQKLADARAVTQAPHSMVNVHLDVLGAEVADHEATKALVDKVKSGLEGVVPATIATFAHVAPPGTSFAGADACTACHAAQATQWAGTAHAHAWTALADDQRAMDAECIGCHVTAEPGATVDAARIGGMRDVQCEACHGPGIGHVKAPGDVHLVKSPDVATCTRCHDGTRDEGRFDYPTYLGKITH